MIYYQGKNKEKRISKENLEKRNNLITFLKNNKISSQFHYVPLHNSPMGIKIAPPEEMKKTEFASDGIVRLPIYPSLKKSEQEYIKEKISQKYITDILFIIYNSKKFYFF